MEAMIYLDTHVVVWLYAGEIGLLSQRVQQVIREQDVVCSPIVKMELQYLYEIGKILVKPQQVLDELSSAIGLKIQSVPFAELIESSLSLSWTRDPFDRLLVAQASLQKARLITKDQTILSHYSGAFWT